MSGTNLHILTPKRYDEHHIGVLPLRGLSAFNVLTSNKRQHSFVGVTMGRECTGKARIEPTDRINPPDEGPRHMAPCRGGASCLYCKAGIDAGVMSWGQVNPVQQGSYAPSLTGLQHRAEGVPQAAIPRP